MCGNQRYVDAITLIALVLMVLSGTMALQRVLTEQPGMAPDIHFANVRY